MASVGADAGCPVRGEFDQVFHIVGIRCSLSTPKSDLGTFPTMDWRETAPDEKDVVMTAAAFPITPQVEEQRAPSTQNQVWAAMDSGVFGALRHLQGHDGGDAVQAVFMALIRRLPNVKPNRKRIAADTGFSVPSVSRAIALLERCGMVRVARSKGLPSIYHLADLRVRDVATQCLAAIQRLVASKPRKPQNEGGRISSDTTQGKGGRITCDTGSRISSDTGVESVVIRKEVKKSQEKQQGGSAAAAEPGELAPNEVTEALVEAGIGEPNDERLARLPGISAELIRREAETGQAAGKRTGAIVFNIIAAVGAANKRHEKAKRREVHQQAVDEKRARKREQEVTQVASPLQRRQGLSRMEKALSRYRLRGAEEARTRKREREHQETKVRIAGGGRMA